MMIEQLMDNGVLLVGGISAGLLLPFVIKKFSVGLRWLGTGLNGARGLGSCFGGKLKKRRAKRILLDQVIHETEQIYKGFSRSLEEASENLKALIDRTEKVEEKLGRLLSHAEAGRTDQYVTAALLFNQGKKAEEVSRMLKLPLAQARFIQELRQEVGRGKPLSEVDPKNGHDTGRQGAVGMKLAEPSIVKEEQDLDLGKPAQNGKREGSGNEREKEARPNGKARKDSEAPTRGEEPVRFDILKVFASEGEAGEGEEKASVRINGKRKKGTGRRDKIAMV